MSRKMLLVDGSNHAFRLFHAMPRLTAGGHQTGALLGFANLLRTLERDEKPDFVAIVFDRGPSFRVDLFPDYKGHRPEMPDELREQWPRLPVLCEAWGFRSMAMEGFEADDVIGTLATRYASPDLEVCIVSGDKDFCQLVGPHVTIMDLKGNERALVDAERVTERFGVPPDRVVDVLALWGDSSDNVPGVPGIGEKKATALIQSFGSLDALLARAAEVPGKMGESLRANVERALLARRLVTIVTDMDLPFGLDDLAVRGRQPAALRSFLLTYQLRTHLKELDQDFPQVESAIDRSIYRTVDTGRDLEEAVAACRRVGRCAVDTETTSLDPLVARLVGVSLCWSPSDAVYIPIGHQEGSQIPRDLALSILRPLLEDPRVAKTGQNLKYDLQVLRGAGVRLAGIRGDTLIADYLLESSREQRNLDDLAMRYLGHRTIAYSEVTFGLAQGADFSFVPIPQATSYAAEDAHVAWLLEARMAPRMKELSLESLYDDLEIPVIPVLADMELNGIRLDESALSMLGVHLEEGLRSSERLIFQMAGREFNINSPKQLAEILFEERGLAPQKKTKTGQSTDAATLEILAASTDDPLPREILNYRSLSKLKSTYVDALPLQVSRVDGRIHTSFNQAVAATGRLSSTDPNLQNIPIRTEEGRRIRACFVPEPGHVFLSADYSQIELRVLADYCGEGSLFDAFISGEDIHRRTAAQIFHVNPALVSPDQRRAAKVINFGIIYGMSAFRLANELGISRREAKHFIDGYFEQYPQVRSYVDGAIRHARETGFAITRYGRRRMVPDLGSRLPHVREGAERIAVNTPIQGTAADIMKLAMVRVWSRLGREDPQVRLLLQVHDELLLEVPEDRVDAISVIVQEEMVAAASLAVPLKVGVGVGRNWDEAH